MSPPTPPHQQPADEPDLTVPLRRLPLWSSTLSLLAQFAVLIAVSCLVEVAPRLWRQQGVQSEVLFSLSLLLVCTAAMLACLGKRLWVRRRPLMPLRLTTTGLVLPRHAESARQAQVPYAEVVSVLEGGVGRRRALVVEGAREVFVLPVGLFVDPPDMDRLAAELKRRIWAQPGGGEQVERTRRRRHEARLRLAGRPFWSQALVGVMAVMFASTLLKRSLDGPFDLLRWGALTPEGLGGRELWRLWAASFLHTGLLQAVVCLATFYTMASLVERLLGWARMTFLVASASAVVMGVQAASSDQVATVGASGCIFALLGAFSQLGRRLRLVLPLGVLQPTRWWLFIIGLHAAFTLLWPLTQLTVLAVGLAWGALVGRWVLRQGSLLPALTGRSQLWLGSGAVGVMALSLVLAVAHAGRSSGDEDLALGGALAAANRRLPRLRADALARGWLDAEVSQPERRRLAQALAEHNRAAEPTSPLYAETLARALSRQGDFPAALHNALAAIELAGGKAAIYEMAMGRLVQQLGAANASGGDELARAAVAMTVERGSGDLVLASLPSQEAWHVFAVLEQDDRPLAMVHVRAPPHAPVPSRYGPRYLWQREPTSRLALRVAWVHRAGPGGGGQLTAGAPQWVLAPILPAPRATMAR